MQPLTIKLFPKPDADGEIFYIGKLKFPGKITFSKGAQFNVFIDNDICELQISQPTYNNKSDSLKRYKSGVKRNGGTRHSNISIDIEKKESISDNLPKNIYKGNMFFNIELNADKGLVFLVFVADPGEEEVQISFQENKRSKRKMTSEVIKKSR